MSEEAHAKVIIVGGGIIGVSTAYFLAKNGLADGVVLVERARIAAAASGKAGGFLARDWGQPGQTQELHERGFDLHEQLATDLMLSSYRKLPTVEVSVKDNAAKSSVPPFKYNVQEVLLDAATTKCKMMDENTAQVTPHELVTKMWSKAEEAGAKLVIAKASGLERLDSGGFKVRLEGDAEDICGAKVVLAMGPWAVDAEDWVGQNRLRVPMVGIASSSMIVHAAEGQEIKPTACFCGSDAQGCHLELYPRPDNTVYVCGFGGSPNVSKDVLQTIGPDDVKPNESRIPLVKKSFDHITLGLSGEDNKTQLQCCLRPCTDDAVPMIGPVNPKSNDLLIGTGHNCWGILWGPITGQVLADILLKNSTDVDLTPFNPLRFTKK
mmetsp:Transcript_12362/g.24028  ORF Transcript_12362/g.24028 Transcript_12362/m.24028 type:complete len:380 (+) Transcript_12362:367-1506(+)|eukprot:CAMPEP_0171486228 /NCGR_PEP_ID=MMETSP0958-20121227/978_1 /TAXON_ID=87120 /ORGANISM="Aurantiochytrium limacinum, Strain ATCCMYA-1381" /LENGTH=379 /DNA_ID=CAMNT_0012019093 /DNA_START=298 /DNA_END=1437 /DNA_ORIENTATION=-